MTLGHIQVGNAPCSWGVIENVEGARGGYHKVLDEMNSWQPACPNQMVYLPRQRKATTRHTGPTVFTCSSQYTNS
jgi:hypothetical protein